MAKPTTHKKNEESDIPFEHGAVTANPQTTALSTDVNEYAQYANVGFEAHTAEDYSTPFLGILQSNSPQLETIATSRPGMLINTVTKEVYDAKKGVGFVPAHTEHVYVEWTPRDQGGGFVAIHQLNSPIVEKAKAEQERGKYKTDPKDPKSNDLIETFYVYGILVKEDGSSEQIVVPFTSTKNPVYKNWMTKARSIQIILPDGRRVTPPIFAHRYRITSIVQKNAKGSFYNFQITYDGEDAPSCRLGTKHPLFQEADAFRNVVTTQGVKMDHNAVAPTNAAADDSDAQTVFA